MRNKLFTASVDKMLFKQYSMGSDLDKQKVVTKIFNPYGEGRWYLLNSDPNDPDYIWAIVSMFGNVEMGSVSRSELESIRLRPFGLPLERDIYFTPKNAKEVYDGLLSGKFFEEGGETNQLYTLYLYYGGGQNDRVIKNITIEQARKLALTAEHCELVDNSGNLIEIEFAKGGELFGAGRFAKGGEITPELHGKVISRTHDIYEEMGGKTKDDFDIALDKAIIEFGYDPEQYHLTMQQIGAEFDIDIDDDKYAKGGGFDLDKHGTLHRGDEDSYAKGGKIGNPITFGDLKVGEIYFQVTLPDLGIEKITITEIDGNRGYEYLTDKRDNYPVFNVKYQGTYSDREELYRIYKNVNDAKNKAIELLIQKMSKYAKGGEVDGGNLRVEKKADGKYYWSFTFNSGREEKSFSGFETSADAQKDFHYRSRYFAKGGGTNRPLYVIANEIRGDWKNVYFGAKPYLSAMSTLNDISDYYFMDSARDIVNYFLANATTWRGDNAKRIKAELKSMVK